MIYTQKSINFLTKYDFSTSVYRNSINLNISYSQAHKLMTYYTKEGLFTRKKVGRIMTYDLTKLGKDVLMKASALISVSG